MFCVLKEWHPMVGVDFHTQVLPPPAPPVPFVPYYTGLFLFGSGLTCKYAPTSLTHGFSYTMLRGTDIGPLIPHIGPPSITLPIEMVLSGSKSHFGPSAHVLGDQWGGSGPIAAALLMCVNPNLNCGMPMPTPTGAVLALTTHVTGMTLGDIYAGFCMMMWDLVLQTLLNLIGNGLGNWLGKGLGAISRRLGIGMMSRAAARAMCRQQGVRSAAQGMNVMMRSYMSGTSIARGSAIINQVWGRVGVPAMLGVGSPLGPSVSTVRGSDGQPLLPSAYDRATGNQDGLNPERRANAEGQQIDQSSSGQAVNRYLDGPEQGPTELFP
jgi:hypothetical protein